MPSRRMAIVMTGLMLIIIFVVLYSLSPHYLNVCDGHMPAGYGLADAIVGVDRITGIPYTINPYSGAKVYSQPETRYGQPYILPIPQSIQALVDEAHAISAGVYYGRISFSDGSLADPALFFISGSPTLAIGYYPCMVAQ